MSELGDFQNCYRSIFEKTNGFVLNWPVGSNIRLGDFFSLKPGKLSIVGSINDSNVEMTYFDPYENREIDFSVPSIEPEKEEKAKVVHSEPPSHLWMIKQGCNSDYIGNKMLIPHKRKVVPPEVNQYITRLQKPSSFFFSAKGVRYSRLIDFYKVHKRIIRRLATQFFNYSEVYLVTEIAHLDKYSIGINREDNAELVTSLEEYFNGDILELVNTEIPFVVEKADRFRYLKLRENGGKIAFRALKMTLSMKAKELTVKKIYNSQDPEVKEKAVEMINDDLHNLIPAIEINSSNASDFFEWQPMSMEDVNIFLGST
ncbi:hypothetical protein [Ekhidna sp.]|uniref:hypothetical protein n=1 Tax=Ekhidna sp. TaxID=2608089 RepID=UPI0032997374